MDPSRCVNNENNDEMLPGVHPLLAEHVQLIQLMTQILSQNSNKNEASIGLAQLSKSQSQLVHVMAHSMDTNNIVSNKCAFSTSRHKENNIGL
jgi:2-oxo-4-hydroxy-4-carboxy--5-ureidoimidazoline (OHCU) decarboxylase